MRARLGGVSDGEMALREALPFAVSDILLIHRESGLLLWHVSSDPEGMPDSDLVSSMLTAIRDFARDALGQGEGGQLDEIQYGGQRILIETAQFAYLAVVVEGIEPPDFQAAIRERVIEISHAHGGCCTSMRGTRVRWLRLKRRFVRCSLRPSHGRSALPKSGCWPARWACCWCASWARLWPGGGPGKVDLTTYDERNFSASGTIWVQNPDPDNPMTVGLTDAVNGFDGVITADGDCDFDGTNLTIPAGSTASCDYTVDMGDDLDGGQATEYTNTATATIGGGSFTGEDSFTFGDVAPTLAAGSEPAEVTATDDNATADDDTDDHHSTTISESTADVITYDQNGICPMDRTKCTNGVYTVILTNIADIDQTDDSDTKTVTVNCHASFVDIYKTTNGQLADPEDDIQFVLYSYVEQPPNEDPKLRVPTQEEIVSTQINGPDLQFQTALRPGDEYTICEYPVPAAYTFEISVNGDNVLTYAGPPGEANPTGEIQCFDFTAEPAGTTVTFDVENRYPGGAPRTPGYWKNWSRCSGGNQAATADRLNGGLDPSDPHSAGVFLLDDLLPQTLGGYLTIETCEDGASILGAESLDGTGRANDAASTLARALLAARLNQDAGVCPAAGFTFDLSDYGLGDALTFEHVLTAADGVLSAVEFDGTGSYLAPKDLKGKNNPLKDLAAQALALYEIIDDYNNSLICTGEESH